MTTFVTIPQELLDEAKKDVILKGFIKDDRQRCAIYYKDEIVGFYQPTEIELKGQIYWRTGNIFVLPEYRNKGIGTRAIIDFFSDKPYGLAYVAHDNLPSLKAFEHAGFVKAKEGHIKNPNGKQLYLMLKIPQLKPGFLSWN